MNLGSRIFLTQYNANNIGGLYGVLLTMYANQLCESTQFFGPSPINEHFQQIKELVGIRSLAYSSFDIESKKYIRGINDIKEIERLEEERKIQAKQYIQNFNNEYLSENYSSSQINDSSVCMSKEYYEDENCRIYPLLSSDEGKCVISYLCVSNEFLPPINKEKLDKLKLSKGNHIKLMKEGFVQVDDKLIKKSDLEEAIPRKCAMLVLDTPNEIILNQIQNNPLIQRWQNDKDTDILSVVHLSATIEMMKNHKFQEFLKSFGNQCDHVFINKDLIQSDENILYIQKLHQKLRKHLMLIQLFQQYVPHIFPKIDTSQHQFFHQLQYVSKENCINNIFTELHKKSIGKRYFQYHLSPKKLIGYAPHPHIDINQKQFKNLSRDCDQKVQQFVKDHQKSNNPEHIRQMISFMQYDPEVIILGTASSIPQTYRNVPSFLIKMGNSHYLLDCGEGTTHQLWNQFGSKLDLILTEIEIIFISHIHADHHLGIAQFVQERKQSFVNLKLKQKNLYVIAPKNLISFLKFQCLDIQLIESGQINNSNSNLQNFNELIHKNQLLRFQPIPVPHCPHSFGIIIQHKSGFKIVYGGDCRPSQYLIQEGQNATILIHEATFSDDMIDKALQNNHSTIGEAIEVAQKMNAWRLILTHFSQRYTKFYPQMDQKSSKQKQLYFEQNSIYALDHMQAKLSDFHNLPQISKSFQLIVQNFEQQQQ